MSEHQANPASGCGGTTETDDNSSREERVEMADSAREVIKKAEVQS